MLTVECGVVFMRQINLDSTLVLLSLILAGNLFGRINRVVVDMKGIS